MNGANSTKPQMCNSNIDNETPYTNGLGSLNEIKLLVCDVNDYIYWQSVNHMKTLSWTIYYLHSLDIGYTLLIYSSSKYVWCRKFQFGIGRNLSGKSARFFFLHINAWRWVFVSILNFYNHFPSRFSLCGEWVMRMHDKLYHNGWKYLKWCMRCLIVRV